MKLLKNKYIDLQMIYVYPNHTGEDFVNSLLDKVFKTNIRHEVNHFPETLDVTNNPDIKFMIDLVFRLNYPKIQCITSNFLLKKRMLGKLKKKHYFTTIIDPILRLIIEFQNHIRKREHYKFTCIIKYIQTLNRGNYYTKFFSTSSLVSCPSRIMLTKALLNIKQIDKVFKIENPKKLTELINHLNLIKYIEKRHINENLINYFKYFEESKQFLKKLSDFQLTKIKALNKYDIEFYKKISET